MLSESEEAQGEPGPDPPTIVAFDSPDPETVQEALLPLPTVAPQVVGRAGPPPEEEHDESQGTTVAMPCFRGGSDGEELGGDTEAAGLALIDKLLAAPSAEAAE